MEAVAGQAGEKQHVRVVVVDDSMLCRDLLKELLETDPELEVVGMAENGEDALAKVTELQPDIVTMDLRMPVMDGIAATAAIMAERPTPILVLTGHPFQSGRNMTFDAIRAGALDLMIKPELGNTVEVDRLRGDLTRLVKFLAQIEVTTRHALGAAELPEARPREITAVAIAASAGGPRAVHEVLSRLPPDFPAGIVLVQHIVEGFIEEFAAWLDAETNLSVRVADQDDDLRPGTVLVAPSETHMRLMPGGHCKLIRGQPINGYRPSADVLMSSIARVFGEQACGVILSGMGEDGVAGLSDIHTKGGLTIAQDEGSCVVFGMPGAAVSKGVVDAVLPLEAIADELIRSCPKAGKEG